jgi:S1-C subfamily serine protease
VPAEYLRTVLDDLLKKNKIERTSLGVNYINLGTHPKIDLQSGEMVSRGAILSGYKNMTAIVKGSQAEKAGLKLGDIIVAVEEDTIGAGESLSEIIQNYDSGQKIKLTIVRDGEEKVIEVVLGKSE